MTPATEVELRLRDPVRAASCVVSHHCERCPAIPTSARAARLVLAAAPNPFGGRGGAGAVVTLRRRRWRWCAQPGSARKAADKPLVRGPRGTA
ncbi:unnamed protein product [Lampetra fluviatilis]